MFCQVEHLGIKNRKKCFNKRMEIYEEVRRMALITGKENEDDDDDEPNFMEAQVVTTNFIVFYST